MKPNIQLQNTGAPAKRTCPFHPPKGRAGVSPFRARIALLLIVLMAVGVAFMIWHLYRQQVALYHSMAIQGTSIQVETLKQFRKLYSDEIASRAKSWGLEVVHDYEKRDRALPLPATLTMKLGEAIGRERPGAVVRLYSEYPFPWRKETGGAKDAFEVEALRELKKHPDQPFYRFENFQGRSSLRFAVADRMQSSCVTCHNTRPDSPKTDWKVGDVRGVLEFIRPLDNAGAAVASARASLWWAFSGIVAILGVGLLGFGFALRGLRRSSASLQKSEERVRAVIDTALDAMITMDSTGFITDWNPQAEAIFGWTRQEAIGRRMSETIIPREHRERHDRGVKHFLASGEGPVLNQRIEITALRRDGSEFPVELSITPLKAGEAYTFSAFIRDLSQRKAQEAELEKANKELLQASRQAGMAEVATGVLHNVGNVLNSVNVSSTLVADNIRKSKVANLSKVVTLMREQEADLAGFLTLDPKGRQLPGYLAQLAEHLAGEQTVALKELAQLQKNIEHIKDIVAMQQSYAKVSGLTETVRINDLLEDALRMNASALARHEVETIREFADVPPITIEKHKILQILVNLIRNAKYACDESGRPDKRLTLRVASGDGRIKISVMDNGVGIPAENLTRIFNHGFTTRKEGHGFGLHSGALAAKEMGGELLVQSDGPGQGATFTLDLPLYVASENRNLSASTDEIAA